MCYTDRLVLESDGLTLLMLTFAQVQFTVTRKTLRRQAFPLRTGFRLEQKVVMKFFCFVNYFALRLFQIACYIIAALLVHPAHSITPSK